MALCLFCDKANAGDVRVRVGVGIGVNIGERPYPYPVMSPRCPVVFPGYYRPTFYPVYYPAVYSPVSVYSPIVYPYYSDYPVVYTTPVVYPYYPPVYYQPQVIIRFR